MAIPIRKTPTLGLCAHIFLLPLSERKLAHRELLLRELPEEVGLILGVVEATPQLRVVIARSRTTKQSHASHM